MKRIFGIAALAGLLTAAPAAFAGVDFSIGFFVPAPVYVAPAPVYVAPAPVYMAPPAVVYYRSGPYWRGGHEYFEHRGYRERFEHGRHYGRGWD